MVFPTVTVKLPDAAPDGTTIVIFRSDQVTSPTCLPLKLTVDPDCVRSKSDPAISTSVPGAPDAGESIAIEGALPTLMNVDGED